MESQTVLVVDDNSSFRSLCKYLIEGMGYQYVQARNAQEARQLLQTLRPALVFMDIYMPGKEDGYSVTRYIKDQEELSDIPIVIISAALNEAEAHASGCDGSISKPVKAEDIEEYIKKFLVDKPVDDS